MSYMPEYEKLLEELSTGELPIIIRKTLDVLFHASKGLTRRELIRIVYGEEPINNLSNDTRDRKIRKGIEHLRNLGCPIVSTSGKAGYKLDTDSKNIESMIREWESRIVQLQQRVNAVRRYYDLFIRNSRTKQNDG